MATDSELDVFVSYAHADNGTQVGGSVQLGWVTALAANLNQGPNVLTKRIFIDHALRPGDNFSSDLLDKVARSSLLVLLLSQNYVESTWCGDELAHFIQSRHADGDKPSDVFVVELVPYEELVDVPPRIQQLRKHLIHAKFWYKPIGATEASLAGYPSAQESGPIGSNHYWNVLGELRATLDRRVRALRAQRVSPAIAEPPDRAAAAPTPPRPADRLGAILLADVTDDLETQRNALRIALEPEGVEVLPRADYVGLTAAEFEAAVSDDLARANLFVQLLSTTPGRKGRDFAAPLPQLQFQRAQARQLPLLQWCEQLPAMGQIADSGHASLFETESLRATHLTEFKTIVLERLHALKAQREQRAAPIAIEGPLAASAARRWVFFDDVAAEPKLSERLRAIIRAQDFGVRSLPAGAPLRNNGIDVVELLRPCRAGITIYTDHSKYVTAYNRLVYFLNQVAQGDLPMARWGLYLQQGTVASEFGIASDEVVPIDEHGLADFLRGL